MGLVITSRAFSRIQKDPELISQFWTISNKCKSVVGCRMQPNQKAEVVNLVKKNAPPNTTTVCEFCEFCEIGEIGICEIGIGI